MRQRPTDLHPRQRMADDKQYWHGQVCRSDWRNWRAGSIGPSMSWGGNEVESDDGLSITYSGATSEPRYYAHDIRYDKTVTTGGTTGAQTINKNAGSINFAAADASKVVTNARVSASSIIVATVATNDATMTSVQAVAATGSFTLYSNAAATAGRESISW